MTEPADLEGRSQNAADIDLREAWDRDFMSCL